MFVDCDDRCSLGLEFQPPPDTDSHYSATFTKQSALILTHIHPALMYLSVRVMNGTDVKGISQLDADIFSC